MREFPLRPRRLSLSVLFTAAMAIGLAASGTAQAHFLWLKADGDGKGGKPPVVHSFLSETPEADGPELLSHIAQSKITAGGKTLSWTKGEETYLVTLPDPAPKVVDGFCDLGVMKRKDAAFRLLYTARVQFSPSPVDTPEDAENLRVRLVARPGKSPVVAVTFRGKPAPGAVVKAYPAEGDPIELKTDDQGQLETPGVAEGKTGLLAKWSEKAEGEKDGKAFTEARYYATLTVAPAKVAEAKAAPADNVTAVPAPFALLPEAVNSFGGAVAGDWLYVYSGHLGDTHKYHEGTTTKHFRRLSLKDRTTWEDLPSGPALQGVTLMAHAGKLYRIGGMSAHNKAGQPNDLISVADFARFDPESKTWTNLPSLPAPRSTHDAVVAGDKLYVVGGWTMKGGDATNSDFCEDALVFDLSNKDARWETLPTPPFQRRALAVAELDGRIYVLGGLTDDGKVVKTVDIYDPKAKTWSTGPELPGSKTQGFAASAFSVNNRLYVSGVDGYVHRLNQAGDGWEVVDRLAMPRLTHRLLPGNAGDLLAVGGNFAGSPTKVVESIAVDRPARGPKVLAWSAPMPGPAKQGQAIGLVRSRLVAVGGNRTSEPHAFDAENLVSEAASLSIGRVEAEPIAALPAPRQSSVLAVVKGKTYLLGGIGPDGDVSRTLGDVFQHDAESGKWVKSNATIPDARGMFGAATYKDAVYVFGGSIWDPRPGHKERAMTTEVLRWSPDSEGSTFESIDQKLPRARRSFAGAVIGSKYYLVGGLGDDQKVVDVVDVYDFDSKTWSTIPAPPQPRLFADMASPDGKLYLAGGFVKPADGHFQMARSIEVYDPATNAWSTLLETSPVPAGFVRILPTQGRLLLYSKGEEAGQARLALVAP